MITIRMGILAILLSGVLHAQSVEFTTILTPDPEQAPFVYDDIANFVRAHSLLRDRADTIEVLRTEYFGKGTSGLIIYVEKYGLTPAMLARAIASHPEDYAALSDMAEWLQSSEPEWRHAFRAMKEYMPDIQFPPTYFLVGAWRGIGSGSVEGSLISVEKSASNRSMKGSETPLLTHELAHFQQGRILGYQTYIEIYGEKRSLLALTIREGIGEFFAKRYGGRYTQHEAEDYVIQHEARLWKQFSKEMNGRETGDWMWQKPKDPDQPFHIAYVLGARIVEAYFENAQDPVQAVRDILSVTDYPEFLRKSGYEKRFH